MDKVAAVLKNVIEHSNSLSVQYILVDKDSIIKEYTLWRADISGSEKVNNKTTYNVFSITKTFAALAILQLAEKKCPISLSWIHLATEHPSFDSNKFFSKIFSKYKKTKIKPNQKFA
jgi:hypothetical protein